MTTRDLMRRERNRREHVVDDSPLAHLFTVPLEEIRRRVSTGSKYVDKRTPKGRRKATP